MDRIPRVVQVFLVQKKTQTIWLIAKILREIIEEKHPNFLQVFVNILYGSKKYDFLVQNQ